MTWKKNTAIAQEGYRDLAYLPRGRSQWDFTMGALAYGARRDLDSEMPDLCQWAARHNAPASARFAELGRHALVLWHGTSRQRAEKIVEHGLFSKGGLWTTTDPFVAHSCARCRSERYATEGAMVCLVLDRRQLEDGRDCTAEDDRILRFHHGLPGEAVEYVLTHEAISFTGSRAEALVRRWPAARFRKQEGHWAPVQAVPVRYSQEESYSSLGEFAVLTLRRLLRELGRLAAVEAFSTLYSLVSPMEALTHDLVFGLLDDVGASRAKGGRRVFLAR